MLQIARISQKILLVVLIILLIPFLYIFRYAELSGDDFTRAIMDINDFSMNYSEWFFSHNGRFINGLISILPLYGVHTFKILMIINFISLPIVLRMILSHLFSLMEIVVDNSLKNISALILMVLIIIQLPLPVEFFYWISSMTVYSLSLLSFLMFIYGLVGIIQKSKNAIIIASSFSLISIGNNEIFILLNNYIVFTILIEFYLKSKKFSGKLIIVQLFSLVSGLLVILGPGSKSRQSHFEDGGDFLGSIILSIKNTISLIINQFLDLGDFLVLITVLFLSTLLISSNLGNYLMRSIGIIKLGLISIGAMFLIILTPNYAMGGISYNEGRLGNLIQVLLLLIFFINIFNFLIRKKNFLSFLINGKDVLYPIILCAILLNVFWSNNYLNLLSDFRYSSFDRQETELNSRIDYLKNTDKDEIVLARRFKSRTLNYEELTINEEHWYNRSYVVYLNSKFSLSLKSLSVDKNSYK